MANNSAQQADLMAQSQKLYVSYVISRDLDDLQEAMRCAWEGFELVPQDSPQRPIVLYNLARPLMRRFVHLRQVDDIMKAIQLFRHAFELFTYDDIMRQKCHEYLIFSCLVRDTDLEGSIELNNLHVCMPDGKIKLQNLTRNLDENQEVFDRYVVEAQRIPKTSQDLDSAIRLNKWAVTFFFPSDDLKMSIILINLGNRLDVRYHQQGVQQDLDEAVLCFCRASTLQMPPRLFVNCLEYASNALMKHFLTLGAMEDLNDSVKYAKQAVANFDSQDVLGFVTCLDNLASVTMRRYEELGEVKDLDDIISTINIMEQKTPKLKVHKRLLNLGNKLSTCSLRTGQTEDLRHAVGIAERAVILLPLKDPRRVRCLLDLSCHEMLLGGKLQDEQYTIHARRHLEEAEEVWSSLSAEHHALHPGLEFCLYNIIGRHRFMMGRWDEALEILWNLRNVSRYPGSATDRHVGRYCLNLSTCLLQKCEDTHNIEDINEAIMTACSSIELGKAAPDEMINIQKILGKCLFHRCKITGDNEDLEDALVVLLEAFKNSLGLPFYRIEAGQVAIDILCELAEWDRARELSKKIVDLIVILRGRFLDWTDKQFWLRRFSRTVSMYASIALQAGSDVFDVIDLLETCRGSMLGELIDNRTNIDDLNRAAPEVAQRFNILRDEVNVVMNPSENMTIHVGDLTRRGQAEVELFACLDEIRKLEGFHRFLLGPTRSELQAAAAQGPIVIVNIASIRSDAIIITEDAFVLLPLPELKYEKVEEYQEAGMIDFSNIEVIGKKNRKFLRLLKWLWDNCVKLILQKLDDLLPGISKFHIWWIGIGIASSLPFHAAGTYTGRVRETVLSRAISSYVPTLKILIHGRRKLANDVLELDMQSSSSKPTILIVVMPSTPGNADLKGVLEEAEKVQQIVSTVYSPQLSFQPSAKDTMERMEMCEVVHFACHGQSSLTDPPSSHLLLLAKSPDFATPMVDELRVKDVVTLNLNRGKLAFLSACSTAESSLPELRDEALHLVSAFQVAGYLHTIGNLWPADDKVSVQIVEGFYQHLLEAGEFGGGQNVAKALNKTLLDILENLWRQPLSWVQFVHFGI